MRKQFINRDEELQALEKRVLSGKAEFVVIYGRRRVGKTELINEFIKQKDGLRFLARTEGQKDQLDRLSLMFAEHFDDDFLRQNPFKGWDAFFTYLTKKSGKRFIVAFDEFPWLVDSTPALPSILQDYWDTKLRHSKIFFILCGSSIAMMVKDVLGSKSPLYGRRTGQIRLAPFKFKDFTKFFSKYSIRELIEAYAILGGTPGYVVEFGDGKNIFLNIKEKCLKKDQFLFEDAEFILREELKEPKFYFSILKAISRGKTRVSEIINETGLSKGVVGKYLSVLTDLDFIKREIPATEKQKSRKGIYILKDNFFRFWFRFVYPNIELIENGEQDRIINKKIKPHFDSFVSLPFEEVCKEFLRTKTEFEKIGKWWHKDQEIDICAINEKTKEILFGECKWKDKVNAQKIVGELTEKSSYVEWNNEKRKESFAVFAKSFSRKIKEFDGKKVYCFDLNDIERILK